jgi:hypothetical protein
MNEEEARQLLEEQLAHYRGIGYTGLLQLLETRDVCMLHGPSGTRYQIEIQAVWDDRKGGDLRVIGSIDDGGWRALRPLSSDFIVRPDGTFVGE